MTWLTDDTRKDIPAEAVLRQFRPVDQLTGPERQLCEAADRALRQPRGKVMLVLHLSCLPTPRAHHVRVARVLLQDSAQRHAGQVFVMRNHDLVLLCSNTGEPASQPHAPSSLPQTLLRLFDVDAPRGTPLTSLWDLEQDSQSLRDYLTEQDASLNRRPVGELAASQPISLAGLQEIIAKAPLPGLLVQQTGMALAPDRSLSLAARLSPAFQNLFIDLDKLSVTPLIADAVADPFLFRHFAAALDLRLMALLEADLAGQRRAVQTALLQRLPVLIELGLPAIFSPTFARLARLAAEAGLKLWVAISLLQAVAELDLLDHARGLLHLTGCSLVINCIDATNLGLVRLEALQPDIVVLRWSAELRAAIVDQRLSTLLAGPTKLVLAGVEVDQAIACGQSHGFSLFQGSFLDQVQAATRMQRCHSAASCTVRQCMTRAGSLAIPGRAGCANPALLAAAFGGSA